MRAPTDRARYQKIVDGVRHVIAAAGTTNKAIVAASAHVYCDPCAVTQGLKLPPELKQELTDLYEESLSLAMSVQDFESPTGDDPR